MNGANYKIENRTYIRFVPVGQTNFTLIQMKKWVSEFIIFAMEPENCVACSRANFIFWLFHQHKICISQQTITNYKKRPKFNPIIQLLDLSQKAQLENRALFAKEGHASAMSLMLKNVGYVDRIENTNISETTFNLNREPKKIIDKTGTYQKPKIILKSKNSNVN